MAGVKSSVGIGWDTGAGRRAWGESGTTSGSVCSPMLFTFVLRAVMKEKE